MEPTSILVLLIMLLSILSGVLLVVASTNEEKLRGKLFIYFLIFIIIVGLSYYTGLYSVDNLIIDTQ